MAWTSLLLLLQDPATLVERLGSDDIEVRQHAEADLIRLGSAAEAELEKGARHPSPELSARATRVLYEIVAPHRVEAKAELDHLRAHLREAVDRKQVNEIDVLVGALFDVDPGHPFVDDFLTALPEWIGLGGSMDRVLKLISESTAFARMPDRAAWTARGPILKEAVASTLGPARCVPCARWKLSTMKVGLSFENVRAVDILSYLKDVGNILLIVDAMVSDEAREVDLDRAVTIEAKDVTLGEALDRVLAPCGLEAVLLPEEGVVLARRKPR